MVYSNAASPYYKYLPFAASMATQAYNSLGSNGNRAIQYGRPGRNIYHYPSKRRKTKTRVSLKQAVMRMHPAKHFTLETSTLATHQSILSMSPTQGIVQGDGNNQRDGDAIRLEALKLKGVFVTAPAAGAYQYRLIVGWSGEEITTAGIANTFVVGLSVAEVFLPNTSANWVANGIINPKAFTVLYDQTFDLNSQIAVTSDLMGFENTVPIHQDYPYQQSASVMGKSKNLFVIVIFEVAGGTAAVTAAGNIVISGDLIFKNQ